MYLRSTVSVTHVGTPTRPKGTWSLPKELGLYPRQDSNPPQEHIVLLLNLNLHLIISMHVLLSKNNCLYKAHPLNMC